jgi:ATP-dependent DNA helicase PIF1
MNKTIELLERNLNEGKNILITGPAGTGKSHAINHLVSKSNKNIARTASTGIAATHISGSTIHSFCGLTPHSEKSHIKRIINNTDKGDQIKERVQNTDIIIIDEVSMLSPETIDLVDEVFKCSMDSSLPFGGKQLIMSGDFLQIPPVYNKERRSNLIWAFQSKAWLDANISVIATDTVYRQDNLKFINALNEIRQGQCSSEVSEMMASRVGAKLETDAKPLKFLPRNNQVDLINANELSLLPGEEKNYSARIYGKSTWYQKQIRDNCIANERLALKKNSQVIIIKNDPEGKYCNGSLGRVVRFENGFPVVKIERTGWEELFEYSTWEVRAPGGETLASFEQIPLKLAYALTIHKAQGMTLDHAEVDPRGIFTEGQLYVALSRVRSLEGLRLLGWQSKYVKANQEALNFYNKSTCPSQN